MGLFSNKKNPCVLCGEPTPRLFAKEACGGKLCSDCGKKVSMEEELLKTITLDGLKQHMAYREENARLHETFNKTRVLPIDGEELVIDYEKKLFYLTSFDGKNKPIFRFDELTGFAYVEKMEGKFDEMVSSNKLFLSGTEAIIHERGVRVVYEYTREKREKGESLLELYKEELHGVAYSKNLVDHILGVDDALIKEKKPVKQMYLIFEFKNPYWTLYRKNLLEPAVPYQDEEDESRKVSGRHEYVRNFERKLEAIAKIAEAVESIFDE